MSDTIVILRLRKHACHLVASLVLFCILMPACASDPGAESALVDPLATAVPVLATEPLPVDQPSIGGSASEPLPTLENGPITEDEEVEPGIDRDTRFDQSVAPEVSGIVVSRRDPNVYWMVDDGPGTTSVVAIGTDGRTLGHVQMNGVEGRDTEDLAAGPCSPEDASACLFVGDIGDNLGGVHPSIQIHRFAEPDPSAADVEVTTATYTYADGPRDAEALIVTTSGLPVILSKEEGVTGVYASTAFSDGTLTRVADVVLPQPTFALLTSQAGLHVTAADSTSDGQGVILRTYDSVIELRAPTRQDAADLSTMASWPVADLEAPFEPQGEAIAYLPNGTDYVTVSERSGRISVISR